MIEVLGRDSSREATRVAVGGAVALLPDAMISTGQRLTGGHGHQTAYEYIARHAREIEEAMAALQRGDRVRPPFDMIELETG